MQFYSSHLRVAFFLKVSIMPLKDRLIVPVEIPAWGVISALIAGAFAFGTLYSQLGVLVESQKKLDLVFERQVRNIEKVEKHEGQILNHEERIRALEVAK